MAITSATQLTGGAASDDFAQVLLDMSLTGVILFRPLYAAPGGPISDLAYEYLNPAAQQMLRLPERPTDTFLTLYPAAQQTGVFAFYAAAFASGQTERYQVNYQHDNLDGYFHLVARQHGELLVVSFTDTNDQPRSAVEEALRQSQAREQQALAEAERQRAELQRVFAQSPVAMGLLRGPDLLIEMANARMGQLWGRPVEQLLGRPHFEALPDLAGQGFEQVLAAVLATGQPHEQPEQPITIVQPQQIYYKYLDITYLPERDAQGQPTGILVYATDVTEQVLARRQVQDLNQTLAATNEELAVTNEELTASNEEYLHVNTTLSETQLLLRQLNADLESRVQQRTQELRASHHATAALQAELLATARRQVQEREDLYQVFAQSQAVVLLLRGPDHRIEYLNAAAERLFPGRQLRGRPLAESQPESAVQGFVALLDWVYQTGEPYLGVEVPLTVVGETGQPLTTYFNFTYQDYREQGQVVGVSVFAYDVTQQVLARQQREVQQRQLAEIFAQAPVAICLFQGEDYVLDTVNPPMGEMLGRPLADLLGRPFFVAMPELVSQGLPLLLDQVRRTGTPYVAQEQAIHLGRHAAGQVGYFDFVYQPLRDEQARITAIICVATEVTEQVLARQQVQDLNEELAAINEELMATNEELHDSNARLTRTNSDLSTFVYTASHDLKAPITNIEGLVLALRDTLPAAVQQDEMVAHLLGLLDATAHRFVTTITQLTDLSRLQRAYEEPAELLALAPVVAGVLADLAPVIAEAQATVQVQVPAELHVSFTPAGLRSIVYNLLSNAVKYRAPQRPAQVWLQAEWQPGSIVFTVRDNGLGLTDSQQQRLFQVFQRLHTHVEGSGVGLYMIKRLIENAGASIAVTSTVGVGTTFTVTFPA